MAKNTKALQFSDIFGEPMTHDEVQARLMQNGEIWEEFLQLKPDIQEQIYDFLEGKCSLRILYDTFMQKILNPITHQERLESFLSAILEQTVHIHSICPRDGNRLAAEGSLTVMDIIVELENGSLVNLEFQIIGYLFPGERGSCYVADMIMRLYNKTRKQLGKAFHYRDMKPVYLIVMMENSFAEIREHKSSYIHRGAMKFDTGIELNTLENIFYIALDNYRILSHNKDVKSLRDAWMTFFSSSDPKQVMKLLNQYPEFLSLYQEIAEFRRKPEVLIMDFSEALRIMDQNTARYMIDVMKQENDELRQQISDKESVIADNAKTLADKDQTIADKDRIIAELQSALAAKTSQQSEPSSKE